MASKGNKTLNKGIPKLKDAFIIIVKTEWNNHIVDKLEKGAIQLLRQQNIACKTLVVPGAVEIPFAIKAYAESGQQKANAFIALGTVIRGDTPHFDYVCKFVSDGILSLNMILDIPSIFGVLTVNDEQQALERVGGIHGNKGEEAAITAIKMIAFNRKLKK
ncbi:6,7-dimethyl-8-ribityllumazine synthase [Parafilimonas terrae]|uniref:6,7-dimethyl-8-ribityllumazine synthase n=1 Tax=Parafilimonas terrae TaxID=1465490 RepID=A0A1I5WIH2_9BACT|nr:6,7-dimethyl-8-ribityllumazine synthase [Parafilimonas terrae]SFQ19166.1 6,7-dimethyl-8-ribityllumazine synthase [Parafilimonas terrae]